jgi:hypothetical protein
VSESCFWIEICFLGIVHTAQALFEPRNYISLMCRMSYKRKDQCKTQWFDRNDESLNILGENKDLIIKNATFDDHMGLYTCRICCYDQCQKLTSFIYPVGIYIKIIFYFIKQIISLLGRWRKEVNIYKRLIHFKDFIQCIYLCIDICLYYCLFFLK